MPKAAELPPLPEAWGNYAIQGIAEVLPPDAVSWWPHAPGWRYVGIALALALAWYGWRRLNAWIRNRYRREALRQLAQLEQRYQDGQNVLAALSKLLKATALQATARAEVAALSGDAWPLWLNVQVPQPVFIERSCQLLASAQYQPEQAIEAAAIARLMADSRAWIARHAERPRA